MRLLDEDCDGDYWERQGEFGNGAGLIAGGGEGYGDGSHHNGTGRGECRDSYGRIFGRGNLTDYKAMKL